MVLGEETLERIRSVQSLILDYLKAKKYSEERIQSIFSEEIKSGLPASQKLILQQMIRERAKQDTRDLDELIREERVKSDGAIEPKGQVLGVLSKIEGAYIEVLLQQQLKSKELVKQ